jgi:hypothetical protein
MKEEINKLFILLLVFMPLVMGCPFQVSAAGSVNIKNNVRAKANSGGNTISGPGEIKTGDATAKSSVKTNVSGEEVNIKTEASAEANGEKAEINVESNGEDVDIRKDITADGSEAGADVNIDADNNGEKTAAGADIAEENKKGIIGSVKETFESFIDKIISLFTK